ncbi:MAG: hypothetical protein QM783_03155 [Phycisphaerales bacterium]
MTDSLPDLDDRTSRLSRHGVLIALALLPLLIGVGMSTLGLAEDDSRMSAAATVVYTWFTAGGIALAFVLSALGYGWPVSQLLATGQRDRLLLQPAAGLAVLLFVDHLVGVLGGLSGSTGKVGAGVVMAGGLLLLAVQAARVLKTRPRMPRAPWTALLGVVSVGVLLVAAANPPGILWRSEAGGFDAMSYHLPLAQEWAMGGRIWPLTHNVYSFLPSYGEAGFTQIAALTGGRLAANEGVGVLACQYVHVGQALIAAFTVGALAAAPWRRCGLEGVGVWIGGGLGFASTLAVPWTVVTGSLAYNEMPALALLAGASLAALSDGSAWKRGLGAGLLLGASAACKPTFLLIGGPTVALVLLTSVAVRMWPKAVLAGVVGGIVMLAPPLARNYAACGSPVFPLSMSMGKAYWSDEQAARFSKAHGREGTVSEQIARLVAWEAPRDPITNRPATFDGEPRGMFHGQWGMMFPFGMAAAVLLALRSRTRLVGVVLFGGIFAGCVAWVLATHGQSRFLMPLLPNLAGAIGTLAAWMLGESASVGELPPLRRLSFMFVSVMPLLASASTARLFMTENGLHPNEWLTLGVPRFTGESAAARYATLPVSQRQQLEARADPQVYAALRFEPDDKLFMLGDATPLYYLCPTVYNTTWDRSVVGLAMQAHPDEPAAWTRAVQATGATYILINHAEIRRYNATYGFDPAITSDRLQTWIITLGEPVRAWESSRGDRVMELFEVPAEKAAPPTRRSTPKPKSDGPAGGAGA